MGARRPSGLRCGSVSSDTSRAVWVLLRAGGHAVRRRRFPPVVPLRGGVPGVGAGGALPHCHSPLQHQQHGEGLPLRLRSQLDDGHEHAAGLRLRVRLAAGAGARRPAGLRPRRAVLRGPRGVRCGGAAGDAAVREAERGGAAQPPAGRRGGDGGERAPEAPHLPADPRGLRLQSIAEEGQMAPVFTTTTQRHRTRATALDRSCALPCCSCSKTP